MEIVLYIIGGIVLLAILMETGILSEFITMIVSVLMGMGLGALIGWLAADNSSAGSEIGAWIAFGLYLLSCIVRIIWPDESEWIELDAGGNVLSKNKLSTRGGGIAGIVMLIIVVCLRACA
ncbi:MAG: hypothetical protein IKU50_08555 [Bacteroidaceae bacterium]|nr:hypothetical protein [Bacteroidaceae bacterium]